MKIDVIKSKASSKTLRMPHQQDAVDNLNKHFNIDNPEKGQSGLLVMPTGSGKTFTTVSWLLNIGVANNYKILWLVHRQELINQTQNEFENQIGDLNDYGIESVNIMSVSGSPEHNTMSQLSRQDINICSIYSLASKNGMRFIRRMLGKPGERKLIVVIDEAHHATMPSYKKVLDRIEKINPNRILLGLTATPIRMNENETIQLNKMFNAKEYLDQETGEVKYEYVYEINLADLIKTGFLSKPHYKHIDTEINGDIEFDISDAEVEYFNQFGELTEELKRKLAKSQSRNELILKEYLANKDKYGKTLIFAINQLHATILNKLFTEAGIKTDYAISNRVDSPEVIKKFKGDEFDVLINVQMLTEGTDVPNIQTVFLTRETNSDSLLMQMVGRGLRGVEAGGTENAYIISFHDKWEKIKFWMEPEFVTGKVEVEEETPDIFPENTELGPNVKIIFNPREDLNIQELLEKLYDVMKVNIISKGVANIIPDGWYSVFDEDNEKDANVIVYDDQILSYQLMEDSIDIIIDKKLSGEEVIRSIFKDSKSKPDIRDIELIIRHITEEYKMPDYYSFEQRSLFEPKLIANQMKEEVEDEKNYEYWLKEYYAKNPILENLYKTFYAFKRTILDELKENKEAEIFSKDDRAEFKIIPGYYDLDELFNELMKEYPYLTNTKLNGINWSKKVYKTWLGKCYAYLDGSYSIFVNILLSSPNVSREAVKYLVYHELLHANGLWFHDDEFRNIEWEYPNSAELDGELDELMLRYKIDFKELKKIKFETIPLEMSDIEDEENNLEDQKEVGVDSDQGSTPITEVKAEKFKFCRNCGNKLPLGAKFCDRCGENVEYN